MKSWGFYFRSEYGKNFFRISLFFKTEMKVVQEINGSEILEMILGTLKFLKYTVSIKVGHVDFEYQEYITMCFVLKWLILGNI